MRTDGRLVDVWVFRVALGVALLGRVLFAVVDPMSPAMWILGIVQLAAVAALVLVVRRSAAHRAWLWSLGPRLLVAQVLLVALLAVYWFSPVSDAVEVGLGSRTAARVVARLLEPALLLLVVAWPVRTRTVEVAA